MGDQRHTSPAFTASQYQGIMQAALPSPLPKQKPPRSYEDQLRLDREAMNRLFKSKVPILTANGKWISWTADARRNYIEREIKNELNRREVTKQTTTARIEHPEKWERDREEILEEWTRVLAAKHSHVSSHSRRVHEDRDDEEVHTSSMQIKGEPGSGATSRTKRRYDFDEDSDDDASSSREVDSRDEVEQASRSSKQAKAKRSQGECFKSIACTRGLAMKLGVETTSEGSVLAASTVASANGSAVEQLTKRYWKWDDEKGDLVEWPPL